MLSGKWSIANGRGPTFGTSAAWKQYKRVIDDEVVAGVIDRMIDRGHGQAYIAANIEKEYGVGSWLTGFHVGSYITFTKGRRLKCPHPTRHNSVVWQDGRPLTREELKTHAQWFREPIRAKVKPKPVITTVEPKEATPMGEFDKQLLRKEIFNAKIDIKEKIQLLATLQTL